MHEGIKSVHVQDQVPYAQTVRVIQYSTAFQRLPVESTKYRSTKNHNIVREVTSYSLR